MGMSASQARYLGLTARRNNNEYQAQQINQQRLNLAQKTTDITKEYSDKMSNTTLLFTAVDSTNKNSTYKTPLTYSIITSNDNLNGLNMRVVDKDGRVVVPSSEDTYEKKYKKIMETYDTEKAKGCFEKTNTDGSSTLFSGENFVSAYMSGLDPAVKSVVKYKDGDSISNEDLTKIIKDMSAAEFYDYWTKNKLEYTGAGDFNSAQKTDNTKAATAQLNQSIAEIEDEEKNQYYIDEKCTDANYLEEKLKGGEWSLQKMSTDSSNFGQWIDTMWQANTSITDAYYTVDDAVAEAKYETELSKVQQQDKELELQLKQLDTEHNALQTELESVKKVIEKNVETSFKTFA